MKVSEGLRIALQKENSNNSYLSKGIRIGLLKGIKIAEEIESDDGLEKVCEAREAMREAMLKTMNMSKKEYNDALYSASLKRMGKQG